MAQLLHPVRPPARSAQVTATVDGPAGARRALRAALVLGLVVLVVVGVGAGLVVTALQRFADDVGRLPGVFSLLPEAERPPADGGPTFLVTLTDSRVTARPAPTFLLVRIDSRDRGTTVVELPPAMPVDMPVRRVQLGTTYVDDGPGALVAAVERLTELRVDHFVVLDLAALPPVADALGGIDLPRGAGGRDLVRVDGAAALAYARAGGDRSRLIALRGLLRALTQELIVDPLAMHRLLDALARAASMDDGFGVPEMNRLVWQLVGVHSAKVQFLRVPVTGQPEGGAVSLPPNPAADDLWPAMRAGTMPSYLKQHPEVKLRWRLG